MRAWALLLGGLLVWAADFLLLYAIGSIFLTTSLARILAATVTLVALAADAWLLAQALARRAAAHDELKLWMSRIAALASAISMLAVVWQGFPAVFA